MSLVKLHAFLINCPLPAHIVQVRECFFTHVYWERDRGLHSEWCYDDDDDDNAGLLLFF